MLQFLHLPGSSKIERKPSKALIVFALTQFNQNRKRFIVSIQCIQVNIHEKQFEDFYIKFPGKVHCSIIYGDFYIKFHDKVHCIGMTMGGFGPGHPIPTSSRLFKIILIFGPLKKLNEAGMRNHPVSPHLTFFFKCLIFLKYFNYIKLNIFL